MANDTTDAQDLVRLAKSIGVCTTLAKLIAIGDTTAFSDLTKRIDEAVIALPKAAATIARLQAERDGEKEARWKAEAALHSKDDAVNQLMNRLRLRHGDNCEDLIP